MPWLLHRCALSCLALILLAPPIVAAPLLYVLRENDPELRRVDTADASTLSAVGVSLPGETVLGGSGLARRPGTGELYALLWLDGQVGRELVTLDGGTGAVTSRIGDTGDFFTALAFDSDGTLFGLTHDDAAAPSSLFRLSLGDASPTLQAAYPGDGFGEALSHDPATDLLYRASGEPGSQVFQSIDPDTGAPSGIPTSGDFFDEILGLTADGTGGLFAADYLGGPGSGGVSDLYRIGTNGAVTRIGHLGFSDARGLVLVPEPGTAWLLMLGLLGLAGRGRRKSASLVLLCALGVVAAEPATAARVARGSGSLDPNGDSDFGFRVDFNEGAVTGRLQVALSGAAEFNATQLYSLARLETGVLEIRGSGQQDGLERSFCLHIEDRADPGSDQDVFRIEFDGSPTGLCGAGEGGLLESGNLDVFAPGPGQPPVVRASSQWPCPGWGMYGRTLQRTFASECATPIDATNAVLLSDAAPGWIFKTYDVAGETRSVKTVTATPAVVEGVVYVGDWSGTMFALDAVDGTLLWRFEVDLAPGAAFGPIVSSAAVADVSIAGEIVRLVIFGAGPRVYALDASNGTPVWVHYGGAVDGSGTPILADDEIEFESSPVVWDDVVYIGVDPHNSPVDETAGVKGGLVALDAQTGTQLRKFEPDPLGEGCGGMWSSPVFDPDRDRVYFATANCPSTYQGQAWGPHIEAVTALDANSFVVAWSFQPGDPPDNREDFDFGATPNLFRDANGRGVLGVGRKDATYYALDPDTGVELWRRQVANPHAGGFAPPGDFAIGGFIGSTAIWAGDVFGGTALGGAPYFHVIDGRDGTVRATDNASGPSYAASGAAGGLVFHGSLDDQLRIYDAATGLMVAAKTLLGPISSGPVIVHDTVYVGSGTSSSDACAKPSNDPVSEVAFQACLDAFEEGLGVTGAVHALRLPAAPPLAAGRLFNGQGNDLDVYDLSLEPPSRQSFIRNVGDDPLTGYDLNAQICAFPDGKHFLLGEDTYQSSGVPQGWGIFDSETKRQVGKLIADYGSTVQPEQYGCAIETDGAGGVGRIFVTQVGGGNFEDSDGQLIVFFPTSAALDAVFGRRTAEQVCPSSALRPNGDCSALSQAETDFCVLDDDIRTAGGMTIGAAGGLYVAEASPSIPPDPPTPGRVLRYDGPFPTTPPGCSLQDPATFIQDPAAATPGAIVLARDGQGNPTGHFYLSSVIFPSVVNEYDESGLFVRNVLPPGSGTPFGLAVDANGTLYYADIGIRFDPTGIPNNPQRFGFDTGPGEGSVGRVRFAAGVPLAAEVLQDGLEFPDGLGITPGLAAGAAGPAQTLPEPGGVWLWLGMAAALGALARSGRGAARN